MVWGPAAAYTRADIIFFDRSVSARRGALINYSREDTKFFRGLAKSKAERTKSKAERTDLPLALIFSQLGDSYFMLGLPSR